MDELSDRSEKKRSVALEMGNHVQSGEESPGLIITEPNNLHITLPKKYRKRRMLNLSSSRLSRLNKSPQGYERLKTSPKYYQNNRDILFSDRIKLSSSSRMQRFSSKLQKLAQTNSVAEGIKTYKTQIEYLRKKLEKSEKEKLQLAKSIKLVRFQELERELAEKMMELDQMKGRLEKANEVITVYEEEKLIDAGGKKKSLVRKFREDSILLQGELFTAKAVISKLEKRMVDAQKDKYIYMSKYEKIKKQFEELLSQQRVVTRSRRNTSTDTNKELAVLKKKHTDYQNQIQKLKENIYTLQREVGTLKHEVNFRDLKIEEVTKKNQILMSQKASIEGDLIARMHDMEANRRQIQKQISSTRVFQVKVKERKRLISHEDIAYIAKKLKFRFMRQRIQYKNIASTIDTSKFKDLFRPTYQQIQSMLALTPFALKYDQQILFGKYLVENQSPLADSDQDQKTNTTPIIKSILQKVIDPYDLITQAQQHALIQSLTILFTNNKTLIQTIRRDMARNEVEFIQLSELMKYFKDYFIEVNENVYMYMELKSFELCDKLSGGINIAKLKEFIEGQNRARHNSL